VALLDLLLPTSCAGCSRFGTPLCHGCRLALRPASNPSHRFLAPDPGVVVGDAFEVALAAFVYEGIVRRALQRLKYGGMARIAQPLAEAAVPRLRALVAMVGPCDLVPVPIHVGRLRERGYNQAELLAAALARAAGLEVRSTLIRQRPTTQQHRLDRAARLRNLRQAFGVHPRARPPPTVILIDDILTTSATLEACAHVLRERGAERVAGFAIGREV
jgi:ComF family protein